MSIQRRYEGAAAVGAKGDRAWQLVMTDPETGLPNHLVVQDRLDQALARRPRHGGEVVVCSITLDNLHLLTDEHGPAAGNQIIREVARRLTEALRTEDTVGRVGASELVGIVTVRDKANVPTVVDRLAQALAEPVDAGTASVVLEATVDVRVSDQI
jgi:diguanylate cyclase (GGDEF)-like protein